MKRFLQIPQSNSELRSLQTRNASASPSTAAEFCKRAVSTLWQECVEWKCSVDKSLQTSFKAPEIGNQDLCFVKTRNRLAPRVRRHSVEKTSSGLDAGHIAHITTLDPTSGMWWQSKQKLFETSTPLSSSYRMLNFPNLQCWALGVLFWSSQWLVGWSHRRANNFLVKEPTVRNSSPGGIRLPEAG